MFCKLGHSHRDVSMGLRDQTKIWSWKTNLIFAEMNAATDVFKVDNNTWRDLLTFTYRIQIQVADQIVSSWNGAI